MVNMILSHKHAGRFFIVTGLLFVIVSGAAFYGCVDSVTAKDYELFETAFSGRDLGERRRALSELTDQGLLAKIALEGEHRDARMIAAGKITDEKLLSDIVLSAGCWEARRAAVNRVTDSSLLARAARLTEGFSS